MSTEAPSRVFASCFSFPSTLAWGRVGGPFDMHRPVLHAFLRRYERRKERARGCRVVERSHSEPKSMPTRSRVPSGGSCLNRGGSRDFFTIVGYAIERCSMPGRVVGSKPSMSRRTGCARRRNPGAALVVGLDLAPG